MHLRVKRHSRTHLYAYEWRDTPVPIYTLGSRGTPVPIYTPGSGEALQEKWVYALEWRGTPEPIYTLMRRETLESWALSIIHTSCQRVIAIAEDI